MKHKDIQKKEELLLKNLKDTKEIFDKHKITYWLDWGTLLGAIRDKKIIEFDDDLDLSTFSYNWEKVNSILPEFEQKEFKVINISRIKFDKGFYHESIILERFGYDVDLYFYQLKNETYFHTMLPMINFVSRGLNVLHYLFSDKLRMNQTSTLWKITVRIKPCLFFIPLKLKRFLSNKIMKTLKRFYNLSLVIVPGHYFEKLERIKFYGLDFNVPSNGEDYLKSKYGETWRTPNKNFNKEGCADWEGILRLYQN